MTKSIFDPRYRRLIDFLRRRRRELGLTQSLVTDQLGVSRSWLGKVEQCERRIDVIELFRLSDIYEISWSEIGAILKERP